MKLETRKGSTRLVVETGSEWAYIELWGANGFDNGANVYLKDLRDTLENMLKTYTYFRGAKSHAAIVTRDMIGKVAA